MRLKVGDKIPHFLASDMNGNEFNIDSLLGNKPFVIYFYPKDNTPGCTAQACSFRDQYQDFVDIGAEVIGVSSDSVESHKKFTNQYKLPFVLLSDQNQKIRNAFGVPAGLLGLIPGRVTYVMDKNGVIKLIFDSSLTPTRHITKALEAIKKLK